MAQTGYTPIQLYYSTTASQQPSTSNLANGELAINITDGKLYYKDNSGNLQVIGWKTVPISAGGTGVTSYTAGDTLYYASGTALSKLAIGSSGYYMSSSGTAPQWSAPAALTKTDDTNVTLTLGGSASTALLNAASLTLGWTGQLAVTRGGTGLASVSQGDILYGSASNTLSALAKNTTATRYLANTGTSNNPAWAQIDLTNGVTGTLPVGNGGTGIATLTAGYIPFGNGTSAFQSSANLYWDSANGRLGLANTSPVGLLDAIRIGNAVPTGRFTNGNNNGSSGAGYCVQAYMKGDNGGGARTGYGYYVTAPYDGTNASGNSYALTQYGVYIDDIYGYNGKNASATWGLYSVGGAFNYMKAPLLIDYTTSNGAYSLQVNSQIFATSATIATSDGRYKENVQELTGALAMLDALSPKTFTWKKDEQAGGVRNPDFGKVSTVSYVENETGPNGEIVEVQKTRQVVDNREWLRQPHNFNDGVQVGFIAQEVLAGLKDHPFVGNLIKTNTMSEIRNDQNEVVVPKEDFYGIAEGNMIPILTAALKELKAEFEAYKAAHP